MGPQKEDAMDRFIRELLKSAGYPSRRDPDSIRDLIGRLLREQPKLAINHALLVLEAWSRDPEYPLDNQAQAALDTLKRLAAENRLRSPLTYTRAYQEILPTPIKEMFDALRGMAPRDFEALVELLKRESGVAKSGPNDPN